MSDRRAFCDGLPRRDFLRVGAAGLFGMNLAPALLRGAPLDARAGAARADSLIIVFLKGGLSTIDTFDMKPDAPEEFRGEFKPISTNVPGTQICEHLPRMAGQMDKLALIRSFTHKSSDHGAADHYMLTGYHPVAGFNPGLSPNNQRPAHGAIVARKLPVRGSAPAYVSLPGLHPSGGASYLGSASAPFTIHADPAAPNFSVPDVLPPLSIDASRLDARRQLLARVDRFAEATESQANHGAEAVGSFRRKAFEFMASSEVKKAFDINAEKSSLRDAYGRHTLGQSCLMARRLVEAGVRCVTIDHANWDTHDNNFSVLKKDLLPHFDSAIPTMLKDLAERGMLERTLVVITGEFGRTPRINKNAGRDHWGPAFTVALAGGGVRGGVVVGKSDSRAERPAEKPHGPEDLAATIYHQLGINPDEEFITPEGRPIKIVNQGFLIREVV